MNRKLIIRTLNQKSLSGAPKPTPFRPGSVGAAAKSALGLTERSIRAANRRISAPEVSLVIIIGCYLSLKFAL